MGRKNVRVVREAILLELARMATRWRGSADEYDGFCAGSPTLDPSQAAIDLREAADVADEAACILHEAWWLNPASASKEDEK